MIPFKVGLTCVNPNPINSGEPNDDTGGGVSLRGDTVIEVGSASHDIPQSGLPNPVKNLPKVRPRAVQRLLAA